MMINKLQTSYQAHPWWTSLFLVLLIMGGIWLLVFSFYTRVNLIIDGEAQTINTLALTPRGALRAAGISLNEEDEVIPNADKLFFSEGIIILNRAQYVTVVNGDQSTQVISTSHIPVELLQEAGIEIKPFDRILWNGAEIDPNIPIASNLIGVLQYIPAQEINLIIDGQEQVISSSQPTLGLALSEAGIQVTSRDSISYGLETPIDQLDDVIIHKAREIQVHITDQTIRGLSSSQTVAGVLQDLALSLQGMDFTNPGEEEPTPADGNIDLVRVKEDLVLIKEESPYQVTYQPDPETELDQGSVIIPGTVGLVINRTRIRWENGSEVSKITDEPWQASTAKDGVLGYGTKVVVRTETVDGISLEYWRKISVYATSYSPSKQGGAYTGSDHTASGLTLQKGIVAVLVDWYRAMKFQQVYIPGYGYGTIADTGGGIPGRPWIDLGFSDNDYESWHYWVTMYFLTPVPGYIPYLLP